MRSMGLFGVPILLLADVGLVIATDRVVLNLGGHTQTTTSRCSPASTPATPGTRRSTV